MNDLVAICREVDKESGDIKVYFIDAPEIKDLLKCLSVHEQQNLETRYFMTSAQRWENKENREVFGNFLCRKYHTPEEIDKVLEFIARIE